VNPAALSELTAWITEAGLAGKSETAMLGGFCCRAVAAGLPIARATVIIDTLHPVHEGRVTRWRREGEAGHTELIEYGSSSEWSGGRDLAPQPVFPSAGERRLAAADPPRRRRGGGIPERRYAARRRDE
jgi:hypothetical protein